MYRYARALQVVAIASFLQIGGTSVGAAQDGGTAYGGLHRSGRSIRDLSVLRPQKYTDQEVVDTVHAFADANKVVIFSRTWCQFCEKLKKNLARRGIRYAVMEVDGHPEVTEYLGYYTGQTSVPNVWLGGEYFGKASKVNRYLKAGKFKKLVQSLTTKRRPKPTKMAPRGPTDSAEIQQFVYDFIQNNNVAVYSKRTCPACSRLKAFFQNENIDYQIQELDGMKPVSQFLRKYTGGNNVVPKVFIDGKYIGNSKQIYKLHKEDRLLDLIEGIYDDDYDDVDTNQGKANSGSGTGPHDTSRLSEVVDGFIRNYKVAIFVKNDCRQCDDLINLFETEGYTYKQLNLNSFGSAPVSEYFRSISGSPDIPSVWINKNFIGGSDKVWSLYRDRRLEELMRTGSARDRTPEKDRTFVEALDDDFFDTNEDKLCPSKANKSKPKPRQSIPRRRPEPTTRAPPPPRVDQYRNQAPTVNPNTTPRQSEHDRTALVEVRWSLKTKPHQRSTPPPTTQRYDPYRRERTERPDDHYRTRQATRPPQTTTTTEDPYYRREATTLRPREYHAPTEEYKEPDYQPRVDHSQQYQYDLVVIGGGSSGIAAANTASAFNKRIALLDYVETTPKGSKWSLGGTCLNVGCIPANLMHYAARQKRTRVAMNHFGWYDDDTIYHNWNTMIRSSQEYIMKSSDAYIKKLNENRIDYFNAWGSLLDAHTVNLAYSDGIKERLTANTIILAVGERPHYPPSIENVKEFSITSDDIFQLRYDPGKVLIIGAGYVGTELAGSLSGIMHNVTLLDRGSPLEKFDSEMSHILMRHLKRQGVRVIENTEVNKIERIREGRPGEYKALGWTRDSTGRYIAQWSDYFNTIITATGRRAKLSGLNLHNAGVNIDESRQKIIVNDYEQTSASNIYAVGDCARQRPELTSVAVKNSKNLVERLYGSRTGPTDYSVVPTTLFTPLEYSFIGDTERGAQERYGADHVLTYYRYFWPLEWGANNRPPIKDQCFTKVIVEKAGGRILGMHFAGPNAGEVMQGFALAMKLGATKEDLDNTMSVYPSNAQWLTKLTLTKEDGNVEQKEEACTTG